MTKPTKEHVVIQDPPDDPLFQQAAERGFEPMTENEIHALIEKVRERYDRTVGRRRVS